MPSDMAVQGDLGLDLLRFDATEFEGMFFIYEFDGDDRLGGVLWACFADAVVGGMISVMWYASLGMRTNKA